MVELIEVDGTERPYPATFRDKWTELLIIPFASEMSQVGDDGWLQWHPDEAREISGLTYGILALAWPFLRLLYQNTLSGQITDY